MNPARPRGCEANAEPTGVFGVPARHEGGGLLVAHLDEADFVLARAGMARRAHDPARRGDQPGDRASLWTRRTARAPRPPVLVSVVRRRHGNGLAFLRHHHQRAWRAQTWADAAAE